MNRDTCLRALARKLGKEYRVTVIDLEPVVYRDFGNGFNVEISGMYTTSKKKKATLYLWFGEQFNNCVMVKMTEGVRREDIGGEVERLYKFSELMLSRGLDSVEVIRNWKSG